MNRLAITIGTTLGLTAAATTPVFAQKTPAQLLSEFQTCAAQGKAPGCITTSNIQDIINTYAGRTPLSVMDYGAKCDGHTDDGAVISGVAAIANAASGAVYFPVGQTCYIASGYNIVFNVPIFSAPGRATITFGTDAGSGQCGFILFNNTNSYFTRPNAFHLNFIGPGGNNAVTPVSSGGSAPAQMDGLCVGHGIAGGVDTAMASQPILEDIVSVGWYGGIMLNDTNGHITLDEVYSEENYYGLRDYNDGGDLHISQSGFPSNAKAGIGCPPTNCLDSGFRADTTVLGFNDYGVYQEAGSGSGVFVLDGDFINTTFEQICLGALYQATTLQSGSEPGTYSLRITHPGFSWNTATHCSGGLYALNLVYGGGISINSGTYPFTAGPASGNAIFNIGAGNAGINITYENANAGPPSSYTTYFTSGSSSTVVNDTNIYVPWVNPCTSFSIASGANAGTGTWQLSDFAASPNGPLAISILPESPTSSTDPRWWLSNGGASGTSYFITISLATDASAGENWGACISRAATN